MEEDFSAGWQARAGARAMANALELQLRAAETQASSLVILGRYIRRSRRQRQITQAELAERAGVSQSMVSRIERGAAASVPLERFLAICMALGRLFPLGACPHDHPCAWVPVRIAERAQTDPERLLHALLRNSGEPIPGAHHAADVEVGVELDEIGALAGREAAAIVDAEHLEGVARRRGDRGG